MEILTVRILLSSIRKPGDYSPGLCTVCCFWEYPVFLSFLHPTANSVEKNTIELAVEKNQSVISC